MTLLESTTNSESVVSRPLPTGFRKTSRNAADGKTNTSQYTELLARVKGEGLLTKKPWFYINRLIVISAISLSLWTALFFIAQSSNTLVLALAVPVMILQGIMAAQYAFIAHETSHRQVFKTNKLNENVGRILANLLAGLS